MVDRTLRRSVAEQAQQQGQAAVTPPPPPAPAQRVEVQPLPRQQPIVTRQAYAATLPEGYTAPAQPAVAPPEPDTPEAAFDETPETPQPAEQPPQPARPEPEQSAVQQPAAAPPEPAAPQEPAGPEISREGNEAVVALLDDAATHVSSGSWEMAAASLERALRIEPRNAGIWHDLAQIRLQQRNYEQAESLAAKSNSLSGDNSNIRARNWRLIAVARRAQGDGDGADEAEARAVALGQ